MLLVHDPGRTPPLQRDTQRMRMRLHVEIATPSHGPQVGACRGRAPSVADRVLAATETFLLLGVVVLRGRKTRLPASFDPVIEDRVFGSRQLRAERPVRATPLVLPTFPGLAAAKVRKHVAVAP